MKVGIVILYLFFSCSMMAAFGQVTYIKETKEEDKVCGLILDLPVVRHADHYVRTVSKSKRHLCTLILNDPTKGDNYYYVKVAEDNGMSYVTHFIFLVNPKTYAVKWLNTVTDERIPLKWCNKMLFDEYRLKK